MPILELKELSKSFSNERVLRKISLNLEPARAICLLGANGSGKTTLLSCIAGILSVDSGSIQRNAKRLGFLSNDSMLYQELSVRENLEMHASCAGASSEKIESLFAKLSLEKFLHKKISECSLGMLKRASLARALIVDPELLLLDEPFSGLDSESIEKICELLEELKKSGLSMIIATHQLECARRICEQAFRIENGGLVECVL